MQDQKSFDQWASEALPYVGGTFEMSLKDSTVGITFKTSSGRAFFPMPMSDLMDMVIGSLEAPSVPEVTEIPDIVEPLTDGFKWSSDTAEE